MPERPHRPGDELPDNCKLYVAGLADLFDDDALRAVFSPFGQVLHAAVIKDHVTGAPRYGFVHFPNTEAASAAAQGMNGKVLQDDGQHRVLTVKLRSDRHSVGNATGLGQYAYDESKLYVAFLPEVASEPEVQALFAGVAPVTHVRSPSALRCSHCMARGLATSGLAACTLLHGTPCSCTTARIQQFIHNVHVEAQGCIGHLVCLQCRLIVDKETGRSKGYAFVTMATKEAAQAAMACLDGHEWSGSKLSVQIAGDKLRQRAGGAPGSGSGMLPGGPAPRPYTSPNPNPHMTAKPLALGPLARPPPGYGVPPGYHPGLSAPYPGAPGIIPYVPPGYGGPLPGYGAPPPGYGPPPGYEHAAQPASGHPPAYGAPSVYGGAALPAGFGIGFGGTPPLPPQSPPGAGAAPGSAPPLPKDDAPPPSPKMQSEYERFMFEMGVAST